MTAATGPEDGARPRPRRRGLAVAVTLVVVAGGLAAWRLVAPDSLRTFYGGTGGDPGVLAADGATPAPELAGIRGWHNSVPTTLAAHRGQVVLLDFWTYTCINCRRSVPLVNALHDTYRDKGLVVLGVHTPEFSFEALSTNVERAVAELGIRYPVAEDPQRATWDAFGNRFWPAKYLIDRQGRIRGTHIGEGGAERLEDLVRSLLDEGGDPGSARAGDPAATATEQPPEPGSDVTREVHLGGERGGPEPPVRVDAAWQVEAQWVRATTTGARLDLDFRARDVYVVVAPERGGPPAEVEVLLDGVPLPRARQGRAVTDDGARTVVRVTTDDLHHLVTGPAVAEGRLTLVARTPGVRLAAFTFGG
jgi:thiol-disulfide isomerase/thioredoxin